MADLKEVIKKHALKNALDFGKADAGAVVGKVIAEVPECKKDMKATMQELSKIIAEVNKMPKKRQGEEINRYEFLEKPKDERKGLYVPNAMNGSVVTRFPPEPSGYPHIGHAKAAFLDYEIARQYDGRMVLRFDDTNPEKESQEFVDAIKRGLSWLGINWDSESYTSDNMVKIYAQCSTLIAQGNAYVCTCSQEEISRLRAEMRPCACRALSAGEHEKRWDAMLSGRYAEGKAVVRFKGDLKSLNTVMRDPALARILTARHYRQGTKYRVWPGYDLAVVVMDAIEGITHPLRTKEYELRDELYYALFGALGLKRPTLIDFARLEIKNSPISKRLLRPLIGEKKVSGWDDPRLPTLEGLKRRGILPEAIRSFVLSFGLSKVESKPALERLLAGNRKMLDPVSRHYFLVPEPVEMAIDISDTVAYRIRGEERTAKLNGKIFIPKDDYDSLKKGEVFALKDLVFVKSDGKKLVQAKQNGIPEKKFQWVSKDDCIKCEVLVPTNLLDENGNYNEHSLESRTGYCESACTGIKEGEIIQFERFGFCRLDKKERDKLIFVYSC